MLKKNVVMNRTYSQSKRDALELDREIRDLINALVEVW